MNGTILTTSQAKGIALQFPRSPSRVLSSHRHELQTYRRPFGWYVREALALTVLGALAWTLFVWVMP